jgi:hypothetical protein
LHQGRACNNPKLLVPLRAVYFFHKQNRGGPAGTLLQAFSRRSRARLRNEDAISDEFQCRGR